MPNDCWNHITLTGDEKDITTFVNTELKNIPEWALHMKARGVKGLLFKLWTRWQPDFKWLEGLLTKYPSFWLKNEWNEEGGLAGVWIGTVAMNGTLEIKQLAWDDLCMEERAECFREMPSS
jgi:hypothetical protein